MRARLHDRPPSMPKMTSAAWMVESRWAMAIVVRPAISGSSASCTSRSLVVSSAEVASSRMRMRGSLRIARAMASRCFSPPESR